MKKIILSFCLLLSWAGAFAQKPIEGDWMGKLSLGSQSLTIVLHVNCNVQGKVECTLDSPDQGVKGIAVETDYCSSDSISVSIASLALSYQGKLKGDEIVGTFTQGQPFPLTLKRGEEKLNRPQNPVAPYPYKTEEVAFKNVADGATLVGTLSYPVGYKKGKTTVVLMVTGSGQENRDEEIFDHKPFLVIADYLVRHGVATLRYDDRGFGKSTGGDVEHATTLDFMRDAASGVDFLRTSKQFGKVGILGHSEGGSIAFMLGAKGKVDFIISMAGIGVKGDTALTAQANKILELTGQSMRFSTHQYRMNAIIERSPWLNFFIDYDPSGDISKTLCPVMAINGSRDVQVIPSLNLMGIKAHLKPNSKNIIKEYPSLNHLFQHCKTGNVLEYRMIEETISPEVLEDIVRFIKQ
ncbi:alpha/beta hydrolase [Prevotella histicola]|uniref:alpha/beta hydrolase n=1 Tax=Prevotella histicola TaxID=470565 RepID=UPI001C5DEFEC|nr:alpha/beta fold hydrolase [Prevotella histicola]MBW4739983.1 alpha/beta hydrolase [Prevotella histicola]MBW4748236.1 alpha/beta hydrolase [Prevotella histicola]